MEGHHERSQSPNEVWGSRDEGGLYFESSGVEDKSKSDDEVSSFTPGTPPRWIIDWFA